MRHDLTFGAGLLAGAGLDDFILQAAGQGFDPLFLLVLRQITRALLLVPVCRCGPLLLFPCLIIAEDLLHLLAAQPRFRAAQHIFNGLQKGRNIKVHTLPADRLPKESAQRIAQFLLVRLRVRRLRAAQRDGAQPDKIKCKSFHKSLNMIEARPARRALPRDTRAGPVTASSHKTRPGPSAHNLSRPPGNGKYAPSRPDLGHNPRGLVLIYHNYTASA